MSVDPDLAAILDNEGPADSVIEAQPETEADLTPDAPPDEIAEPETPAEPEHPEQVPWDDHVKLRHENEAYRKRFQPFEQTFKDVHPDDAEALLNLVRTYATNPTEAASMMRQYADALAANDGEAVLDETTDTPAEQKYLTADELERVLTRREQETAQRQAVQKIESDAVALGYNPDSEDYVALLSIASKNGGDLQAAHKVMTAKRDKIISEYLASKKAESAATPRTPDGVTPSSENTISNLKDADKAAWELLTQQ